MATQTKTTPVSPEVIAQARARAAEARKKIEEAGRSQIPTPQEKADAAPFYFVLRNYVHQLKMARESASMTLADVSKISGIAVESLSRLETGAQTNPTWKTLGMYANAVGQRPILTAESANANEIADGD